MADNKISKVILDYVLSPGVQKTKSGLKELATVQEEVNKALLSTNKTATTTEATLEKLNGEFSQLARQKALTALSKDFTLLKAETGDSVLALEKVNEELTRLAATDSEIRSVAKEISSLAEASSRAADEADRAAGSSGKIKGANFGGATSEIRGLLGSAGGGGAVNVASDILDLSSALPALKESVSNLPALVSSSAAALGPVGIALVATVGAVTLAFQKVNSDLEPVRQTLEGALAANRKYSEFLASGATTEQVEARIAELQKAAETEQQIIDNQTAAMDTAFRNAQQSTGDFVARLAFAVTDGDDKVAASTDAARANLVSYSTEIDRLKAGLEAGELATNDSAAAEQKLTERRTEAAAAIAQLESQRTDALNSFNEQADQIDEDRARNAERAATDLTELLESQETQHQDRMTAIADAGNQRIEQLKEQSNDRLAAADLQLGKLAESLAGITTKLNADRAKVDKEYMASELAALEKFRQQEAKSNAANKKERLRQIEDLNDDLLDAEQNNDVIAFISRQRQGKKELERSAQDADEATRQRQADFEAERAIAAQRRDERIADLEAQANERRADIQEQIQERQAARAELVTDIQEQLEAEKQRIIDTQKAEQTAFDAQQARDEDARTKRNKRQEDDELLADTRRKNALTKQLNEIDTKITAEKNAAQLVGNAWNNMALQVGQVIGGLVSNITARASQLATASGGSGSGSSGGGGQAFALGGIITRPTIAKMGEREGFNEALIPFRKGENLDSALARHGLGGRSSAPNVYITVGDIGAGVSEATLTRGLHELASVVIEGLDKAMRS